jgi:hypothetical protein
MEISVRQRWRQSRVDLCIAAEATELTTPTKATG